MREASAKGPWVPASTTHKSTFGARTMDATLTSFVYELTGTTEEVERFIKLMTAVGLVEVSRTGVAAMARGAEGII